MKERGAGASSVPPHGPCELHDGTVRRRVVKAFVSRSRGCWLEPPPPPTPHLPPSPSLSPSLSFMVARVSVTSFGQDELQRSGASGLKHGAACGRGASSRGKVTESAARSVVGTRRRREDLGCDYVTSAVFHFKSGRLRHAPASQQPLFSIGWLVRIV